MVSSVILAQQRQGNRGTYCHRVIQDGIRSFSWELQLGYQIRDTQGTGDASAGVQARNTHLQTHTDGKSQAAGKAAGSRGESVSDVRCYWQSLFLLLCVSILLLSTFLCTWESWANFCGLHAERNMVSQTINYISIDKGCGRSSDFISDFADSRTERNTFLLIIS